MTVEFRAPPLPRQHAGRLSRRRSGLMISAGAASLFAFAAPALAEAPPAGTLIGNQAIATFNDGVTTRSVTSNLVQTEINQVYGVDIEAPQTKTAAVGGLVTFPHTITNTGNGTDSFTLATAAVSGTFDNIVIYADANCDGVADSATPLSATPALAGGEQFCVVVEADVAAGVAAGSAAASFNIVATSVGLPGATDTNLDTLDVATGPVLDLTKSVRFAPGGDVDNSGSFTPGDQLVFRLAYANRAPNTSAQDAAIVDTLVSGLTYVPGSARWSDAPTSTALDEAADGDDITVGPDAIAFSQTGQTITASVDITSAGTTREGFIEFNATIASTASGTLTNVGTINGTPSNIVPIPIAGADAIAVVLNDISSTSAAYADRSTSDLPDAGGTWAGGGSLISATDNDGTTGNDRITENDPVAEGAVVPFQVILTNHSNTAERFNLSRLNGAAGGDAFPTGTTFSFLTAGGAPLLDVDGNGQPDVLVAANSAIAIQVRADLPNGYSTVGTGATNPGQIPTTVVRATSSSNSAIGNSTEIAITGGVQGASVDLENLDGTTPLADGPAVDNGGAPWVTRTANPGETVPFTLVVENTSLAADSYNLSLNNALLPGWSVVFRNAAGAIVTNTGLIAPGARPTFTAEVTVPAGAAPGNTDLFFRATSATNAVVLDTKLDRVTVNRVADIAISPNREGQVSAGGALVLSHTLENLGNVAVTEGSLSFTTAFPTLSEALYLDDGDGIFELNGEDIVIDNLNDISGGLLPGVPRTIFNRVQASSSAVAGLSESAVITVGTALNAGADTDVNALNNAVTDIVTIVAGDLEVLKRQALDANCDGTPEGSFTTAQLQADPGQCIVYEVTAVNTGTANATDVRIIDTTPAFTTLESSSAPAPTSTGGDAAANTVTAPADEATGEVVSQHGILLPGANAALRFTVQIDSNNP